VSLWCASRLLAPRGSLGPIVQGVAIVVAAVVLLIRIVASWFGVPSPSGDQLYFMPVAYVATKGGALHHPFWSPAGDLGGPYDWHGWLYPIVLSWSPFSSSAAGVVFSATILGVLCLAPWFFLAGRLKEPLLRAAYVISCVAIGLYQIGRPESLMTLWLGLLVLAFLNLGGQKKAAASGVVLALGFVTQPTVAAIALLLSVGTNFFLNRETRWKATHANAQLAAWLAISFAAIWIVAPLGLVEWISGVTTHAQVMAQRSDSGPREFLQYYLLTQSLPFFAGYVVAVVAISFSLARTGRLGSPNSWSLVSIIIIWLLLVWYTAIRIPATFYNLVALGPVIFLLAAWKRAGLWAVGLTSIAFCMGLVHGSIVAVYSVVQGVPISRLEEYVRSQSKCQFAAAPEAWMPVQEALGRPPCTLQCDAMLKLMANTGNERAPAFLSGRVLIFETLGDGVPSVFGVPLARTLKDYAFAVYGSYPECDRPHQ
jgi:hypothetical protein